MNENQSLTGDDDVEGHKWRPGGADAETPEGDDVEGHVYIRTPDGPKA